MHGPSAKWKKDRSSPIKELLGKWLFIIYAILYVGFMFVNVTSPAFMGTDVGGINVAIAFGLILIIVAMILAVAYNHVCTNVELIMNRTSAEILAECEADEAETDETAEDEEP